MHLAESRQNKFRVASDGEEELIRWSLRLSGDWLGALPCAGMRSLGISLQHRRAVPPSASLVLKLTAYAAIPAILNAIEETRNALVKLWES